MKYEIENKRQKILNLSKISGVPFISRILTFHTPRRYDECDVRMRGINVIAGIKIIAVIEMTKLYSTTVQCGRYQSY